MKYTFETLGLGAPSPRGGVTGEYIAGPRVCQENDGDRIVGNPQGRSNYEIWMRVAILKTTAAMWVPNNLHDDLAELVFQVGHHRYIGTVYLRGHVGDESYFLT